MEKVKSYSRRIAIDVAGVTLIILAPLLGWLPGPGGIPLLIAGLSLLSLNHEWARRIRQYLISKGSDLVTIFFPDNKAIKNLYDIVAIALLITGLFIAYSGKSSLTFSLAIIITFSAVALLLLNRQRAQKILRKK